METTKRLIHFIRDMMLTVGIRVKQAEGDADSLIVSSAPYHCQKAYQMLQGQKYWLKIVIFSYFLAFDAPVSKVPIGVLPSRLVWKNQNGGNTRWLKNFEDICITV